MTDGASNKKQCITCNKIAGHVLCVGCQQPFCLKHIGEHRQELNVQLDDIIQQHNLFEEDELKKSSTKKHPILKKIDKWEKDSIEKIKIAAEKVRKSLDEYLQQSKERLTKVCSDMKENLHTSREDDNFSEHDLNQWKEQLNKLKLEITSSSSIKLIEERNAPIYLRVLKINESLSPTSTNYSNSDLQERFLQIVGPVNIY